MKTKFYLSLAGLVLVVSAVIGLNFMSKPASALRYCDDNSIIRCGALDARELQSKYAANDRNLQAIFSHYGISSSMIASAGSAKIGTVKKNGEVIVDGKVIATAAQTVGRHNVSGSTPVKIGNSTYYQRKPADVFIVDSQQAFVFLDAKGNFVAAILQPCGNPIVATPVPKPTPKYSCDSLDVITESRTIFKYTTKRTVQNATYVRTVFITRDGTGKEIDRANSTDGTMRINLTKPGTYSVEAQIVVKVDGQEKISPVGNCKKSFTVKEGPAYDCTKLELIKKADKTYEFKTTADAKNGAVAKRVLVNFGDGESQIVDYGKNASHTYTKPGNYFAVATVTFTAEGKEVTDTSDACRVQVSIEKPPVEECKPGIPVGDERCTEVKECKPGIPVGDDRCAEVLAVTTIAETGPTALISGLLGSSALGLGAASFIRSRRALKSALLNK